MFVIYEIFPWHIKCLLNRLQKLNTFAFQIEFLYLVVTDFVCGMAFGPSFIFGLIYIITWPSIVYYKLVFLSLPLTPPLILIHSARAQGVADTFLAPAQGLGIPRKQIKVPTQTGPSLQLRGEITANNKYTKKSKIEFLDGNQCYKENKKRR